MPVIDCCELGNFENFNLLTSGKIFKNEQGNDTLEYIPTNSEIGFYLIFKLSNIKKFSFDGKCVNTNINEDIEQGCDNILDLYNHLTTLIDYKYIHQKLF